MSGQNPNSKGLSYKQPFMMSDPLTIIVKDGKVFAVSGDKHIPIEPAGLDRGLLEDGTYEVKGLKPVSTETSGGPLSRTLRAGESVTFDFFGAEETPSHSIVSLGGITTLGWVDSLVKPKAFSSQSIKRPEELSYVIPDIKTDDPSL